MSDQPPTSASDLRAPFAWWRRSSVAPGQAIIDEVIVIAARRLRLVAMLAIPVHVLHLAVFWGVVPESPAEFVWRRGILLAHGALLVWMCVLTLIARRWPGEDRPTTSMRVGLHATLGIVLAAGVAIVAIDQLVTTNITPFLVACTIVGLVVHVRPIATIPAFLATLMAYAVAMVVMQPDDTVRVSNLVNGATAVAIGACLALLRWHGELRAVSLRHRVEAQQERLESQNRELLHLATYDTLTGLVNRRHIEHHASQERSRAARTASPLSLIVIDIDDFKAVNDQHGHAVGDAVLQQVARVLAQRLRGSDVVARWGGEEFLAILPDTDGKAATALADELRRHVADVAVPVDDGHVRVTASMGVAHVDVADPDGLEDAFRRADAALYEAKEAGKDRVVASPVTPAG